MEGKAARQGLVLRRLTPAGAAGSALPDGGGSFARAKLCPLTVSVLVLIGTASANLKVTSPHCVRITVVGPAALTPSFAIAAWSCFMADAFALSMSSTWRGAWVGTSNMGVAGIFTIAGWTFE